MTHVVTDDSFKSEVLESKIPVLVDFWAEWCGPCKMVAPILEELSKELVGTVKICKIDVEQSPVISTEMAIRSIPTLILFKNGKQIAIKSGALPKNTIEEWIKSHLA